jgi:hypothetical protein
VLLLPLVALALPEPRVATFEDVRGDSVARPTALDASLPFDLEAHHPVDLLQIRIGPWTPDEAAADLFTGAFTDEGLFVRLDLELRGLINPPGYLDDFSFLPFRYGPHPVFGFVEIDMDADVSTGGELDAPQYRYLGNVTRFGGRPSRAAFADHVALDGSAFDGDFETPPYVERHGEEFHLALLGNDLFPANIDEIEGNGDLVFEAGETWILHGPFFHRAHGFEPFSFVEGGRYPGEYMPPCELRFHHDLAQDLTIVTLVFPLTNAAAGLMYGEPPEPINQDPTDQASVEEALADLQLSAFYLPIIGTGIPEEDIIRNWATREPQAYLDPTAWRVTAILGTSYTVPSPGDIFFVWTDVYPNVALGDVDGSAAYDGRDHQLIAQYIASRDASDGIRDGMVTIHGFATDFSVYDVNYDGNVDTSDLVPDVPDGDPDRDGDLDLSDFAVLQRCFGDVAGAAAGCERMDLIRDFMIDLADAGEFLRRLDGPRYP